MRVFESQRVKLNDDREGGVHIEKLNLSDLEELNGLMIKRKVKDKRPLYEITGSNEIRFLNYAGFASVGEVQIEIYPKIFKSVNAEEHEYERAFVAFSNMLSYVMDIDIKDPDMVISSRSKTYTTLDLLIFFFASSLNLAIKKGISFQYYPRISESGYLRGKVIIEKQISRIDQSSIIQETHEFSDNSEMMQFFKTSLQIFSRIVHNRRLSKDLINLQSYFSDIDTMHFGRLNSVKISFNRLNKHFEKAYVLCSQIIKGLVISPGANRKNSAVSVLFNMNDIFQDFFAEFIKRNKRLLMPKDVTCDIKSQAVEKYLFSSEKSHPLRPDVAIYAYRGDQQNTIIMDTKYKGGNAGIEKFEEVGSPESRDYYQMYVYSSKYQASDSVLVFPTLDESRESGHFYFEEGSSLRIWKINMSLWGNKWSEKLVNELRPLFLSLFDKT